MNDPLTNLKDIHLPADISWWPLAPGWWILAALCLASVFIMVWGIRYYIKHNAYRKAALKELTIIANTANTAELIEATATLVRRTAITAQKIYATDIDIAQLQGVQWQEYLQQYMTEKAAHWIAVERYKTHHHIDHQELIRATQEWIKRHRK
jgi:hypothetical protein